MIETRLFSKDPVTGVERWFHFDMETGDFTIQTSVDTENLLEVMKAKQAEDEHAPRGDMHWAGSIPLNVFYELKAKYPDPEEFERRSLAWLEENNKFKTRRHERLM